MKNKQPTIYLCAVAAGYALLLAGVYLLPPVLQLPLWLAGLIALPPLTLAMGSKMQPRYFYLTAAALFAVSTLVGQSAGVLLFALLFGSALVLAPLTRRTPDLFPILFFGGSLFLALVVLGAALVIKGHYGVFDFRSVYAALEQRILSTVDQIAAAYSSVFGAQADDMMNTLKAMIAQNIDAYVMQIITLMATLLLGLHLWTLKAAQFITRKSRSIFVIGFQLFTVPRSITGAFMVTYCIGIFTIGTDYQYAFSLANTLMGYLFVLCGIGFIDLLLSAKAPAAARTAVKIILLLAAFISDSFLSGVIYSFLMALGVFVSFTRKLTILKQQRKEDDDEHK